jgi:hypothetical protein
MGFHVFCTSALLHAPASAETEKAPVHSKHNDNRRCTSPGRDITCRRLIWWSGLYFVCGDGFTCYPTVERMEGNDSVWPQHFGISKVTWKVWTKLEAVYTHRTENVPRLQSAKQHLPDTKRQTLVIIPPLCEISGSYGRNCEDYYTLVHDAVYPTRYSENRSSTLLLTFCTEMQGVTPQKSLLWASHVLQPQCQWHYGMKAR